MQLFYRKIALQNGISGNGYGKVRRLLLSHSLLLVLLIILSGCANIGPLKEEKITNIERVFMHYRNHYTLWIREPGQLSDKERTFKYLRGVTRVYDVPENQKPWARIYETNPDFPWNHRELNLELHLHSAKEVDGGGWDHRKFGRGQTHIVQ